MLKIIRKISKSHFVSDCLIIFTDDNYESESKLFDYRSLSKSPNFSIKKHIKMQNTEEK